MNSTYTVLKAIKINEHDSQYKCYGPYKTKKGAMKKIEKLMALYGQSNVTYKLVTE